PVSHPYVMMPETGIPEPGNWQFAPALRAHSKITSHFKRRRILPGCVTKARNMLDIPALSCLARQAPQHLKLRTYF
ncbi:MAG: hypothetical protein PHY78_06735, partial [Desulfobacterales bacterium]|nr:hypothetical protein [Desulfobacterales bacterium]